MERRELARAIYMVSHITGNFLLRSGQTSTQYFDKYLFEADPKLLKAIADGLLPLVPQGTEVLAGLEMGGIPIATALSLRTGLPVTFVRKKAKEYGTRKFAEGAEVKGKKVLIIEDVVTTGGQIVISVADLRRLGADIANVLCVIQRNPEATDFLANGGMTLAPLFTMEELEASIR